MMLKHTAWIGIISGLLFSGWVFSAEGIQAGEGYNTRFSGVIKNGSAVIDKEGTVGSIIDLRHPKVPPRGQHWLNEPQRSFIKAKDAGQVFGIAIDDSNPAIIYVTATSKFGLHRNKDNSAWMDGMWGKDAGPGTIYRLQAKNDYQPEIFAEITLDGRKNTGAALGNIAYDTKHKQLFVSDLETGMIYRIDAQTGKQLDHYDHGREGRRDFMDKSSGEMMSLKEIPFNPASKANVDQCQGKFDLTPSCWNLAVSGRRVWGLGIHADPEGTSRLYYSVWAGEKSDQNSIWSIGLDEQGKFDLKDIQREFILPIINKDNQLMVSDLAFSDKDELLVVENGEFRNLGLDNPEPFSKPFDSRLFLFNLDEEDNWELKGRYDVGNISKQNNQEAPEYNSTAGGVDFGYGYTSDYSIDLSKKDLFVWVTGDALCSPQGPCYDIETENYTTEDEVHGLQGMPKDSFIKEDAEESFLTQSYMIDTDINVIDGKKSQKEAIKNDTTKIGDIEIAKTETKKSPPVATPGAVPVPLAPVTPFHTRISSHSRWGSHQKQFSHYRQGSHDLLYSHHRFGSHYRLESHYRLWSHDRLYSHRKYNSHTRNLSHRKFGSHNRKASHVKHGSHMRKASHLKWGSHERKASHQKIGSHNRKESHQKIGSHNRKESHQKIGSHNRKESHQKIGSHNRKESHQKIGSHNRKESHQKIGSHNRKESHQKIGSHNRLKSHQKIGSHNRKESHQKIGSHNRLKSHQKIGSHNRKESHQKIGSHNRLKSHQKIGSHNRKESHQKIGSHNRLKSHQKIGSHNRIESHQKIGSHNKIKSHQKTGSHNRTLSTQIPNEGGNIYR